MKNQIKNQIKTLINALTIAVLMFASNLASAIDGDVEAIFVGRVTRAEADLNKYKKFDAEELQELIEEEDTQEPARLMDKLEDAKKLAAALSGQNLRESPSRSLASVKSFLPKSTVEAAGSFKVSTPGCQIFSEATNSAKVLNTLPSGRKIWIQQVDSNWAKVYRKAGVGYVPSSCLI